MRHVYLRCLYLDCGYNGVLLYKSSEVCQNQLDELARIKLEYGYLYSACATGLFGGLIPFLAMFLEGVFHPAELFNGFIFPSFLGIQRGGG